MIANKLNIVKRAVKAAPLTYNEMDVNLNELINVITDVVDNRDAQALINADFQDANDVQDLALTSGLATKINTASIVDTLTSTDATKVLSAKQGKALSDTVVSNKSDADTKFADRYTKAQDDALLLNKVDTSAVIDVAHGGTGKTTEFRKGFIESLQMVFVGRRALTIKAGAAYIPSVGRIVELTADKVFTNLTFTAGAVHHVYLYDNAGVGDVEISTAVPVKYYGTSYNKTGDTSRRYVGSFTVFDTTNMWSFRHDVTQGRVVYTEGGPGAAPFAVLIGAGATVPTLVTTAAAAVAPKETALTLIGVGILAGTGSLTVSPGDQFATPGGPQWGNALTGPASLAAQMDVHLSRTTASLGSFYYWVSTGITASFFVHAYCFER